MKFHDIKLFLLTACLHYRPQSNIKQHNNTVRPHSRSEEAQNPERLKHETEMKKLRREGKDQDRNNRVGSISHRRKDI
jgi:hypothetical protein